MKNKNYKLVTIDLWDTILRRRCEPDKTKFHCAKYIYLNHFDQLFDKYKDIEKIVAERQKIEAEIGQKRKSKKYDDEYEITEVYENLLKRIFKNPAKINFKKLAQTLGKKEIEFEGDISYLDNKINQLLRNYPKAKKVVLSDFYINAKGLKKILNGKGVKFKIDEIISSCDISLNKRSGRAFTYVEKLYKVKPAEHLHIGDNIYSDGEVAQRLGIDTILYKKENEKANENENDLKQITAPRKYTSEQKQMFELGVKYSSFFVAYVYSILEDAQKLKFNKVYYFTREGEFFKKIHDQIIKLGNINLPKSEILEVSRIATFAPSIREISTKEMMRMWNQYSTQSLRVFFQSLNLRVEDYIDILRKYSLVDYDNPIQYPWLNENVQKLFNDKKFKSKLNKSFDQQKKKLLKYFRQKGISIKTDRVLTCDIGWRGTIQDNLAAIFDKTQVRGHYVALDKFLNIQLKNTEKIAFSSNRNLESEENNCGGQIFGNASVIEMLTNSGSGSVHGYKKLENKIVSVRENNPGENIIHKKYVRYFQAGVLAAIKIHNQNIYDNSLLSSDLKKESVDNLNELLNQPPFLLTRVFKELQHNETFGAGYFTDKSSRPNFMNLLLSKVSKKHQQKWNNYMIKTGWCNWKKGFAVYYGMERVNKFLKLF